MINNTDLQQDKLKGADGSVDKNKKSIFLSLSGSPNAGKSSILNALLGTKIAAISNKPQTTRNSIRGIMTKDNAQVVFIDTPGFFDPKEYLEKKIVKTAVQAIYDCDKICVVLDSVKSQTGINNQTTELLQKCKESKKDVIAIINKIDRVKKHTLFPLAQELVEKYNVNEVFFTSCRTGEGISILRDYIFSITKPDQWYYDPIYNTDRDITFVLSEMTRGKLFSALKQEIPYGLDVETIDIYKEKDGAIIVKQEISTLKESHKGIIIGIKGQTLKKVSEWSVEEMEKILQNRVKLNLSVVIKNWLKTWDGH